MNLEPIGILHSCFKEKFGIPRQAGLVPSASARLELLPPYNVREALRGIDAFSHLWIVFVFHKSVCKKFQPTVRPPRLGGNQRVGVFATRSPFRPNPIGLSVVELQAVEGTSLQLAGGDFLDATPVLDIKPYVPYADSILDADGAFARAAPLACNRVEFLPAARAAFQTLEAPSRQLLCDMLRFNPRPAYQSDEPDRIFGTTLRCCKVRWTQADQCVTVVSITPSR